MRNFAGAFDNALNKFNAHWPNHPARDTYKACRIFDPRHVASLPRDIQSYKAIPAFATPSVDMIREWSVYRNMPADELQFAEPIRANEAVGVTMQTDDDPNDGQPQHANDRQRIVTWWQAQSVRMPILTSLALKYVFFPWSSVEVERSFSAYGNVFGDKRRNLTDKNTRDLVMLYFNGDVEGRFAGY